MTDSLRNLIVETIRNKVFSEMRDSINEKIEDLVDNDDEKHEIYREVIKRIKQ